MAKYKFYLLLAVAWALIQSNLVSQLQISPQPSQAPVRLTASATAMPETQVGKARAEETNDKTSEVRARHRRQLEPLDDYLEDRPLFPERAIDFNVQLIDLLTQNAPKCRMMSVDGQTYSVTNPLYKHKISSSEWRERVRFFSHLDFPSRCLTADGKIHVPEDLTPYGEWLQFGINMYIPVDSGRSPDTIQTTAISLLNPNSRDMWEKSNVRKDFNIYLFKAWSDNQRYKTIKNVICFGLGPVHIEREEENPDDLPHTSSSLNRYRAFLAFDIARMLKVNFQLKHVELIFHDTTYECQHRELIQELANKREQKISFLHTCEAIRKVNGNTLVLAHGLPIEGLPIRSIILDKTERYGGPAGILCEDIPGMKTVGKKATIVGKGIASREKTSKEKLHDPPTKRMVHQMEKYKMKPMCRIDEWKVTMYLKSGGSSRRK